MARKAEVPPEVPAVNCPGRALASATNSFTLFTGKDGCVSSTFCVSANWLIMVKSRSGSKLNLVNRLGLIACGVVAINTV